MQQLDLGNINKKWAIEFDAIQSTGAIKGFSFEIL